MKYKNRPKWRRNMLNYYPHKYTFNTTVTAFSKEVFFCKPSVHEVESHNLLRIYGGINIPNSTVQ